MLTAVAQSRKPPTMANYLLTTKTSRFNLPPLQTERSAPVLTQALLPAERAPWEVE